MSKTISKKLSRKSGFFTKFLEKHRGTIILVITLIFTVFLCKLFFGNGQKALKEEIEKNKQEISALQSQRDSLSNERKVLESKQDSLENSIKTQKDELAKIDHKLHKSEKDLKEAKAQVSHFKSEMDSIHSRITNLKENPIKRTGDELLNSLGKKLKKD